MTRAVAIVVVNIITLVVLLAVAEGVLRAMDWRPPGTFTSLRYENDPLTGPWALPSQVAFAQSPCFRVDEIHTNRFGMRDRERDVVASRPRIALIGDSFTEGLQVSDTETVSRQLENLLGGRVEVLNFGVSSTGTAVEFLNYRVRVRPFRPDVVLLMFFVGNDAEDNVPELKQQRDPAMASISPYLTLDEHGELRDAPQPGEPRRTSWFVATLSSLRAGQWAYRGFLQLRQALIRPPEQVASPNLEEAAWRITEQVLVRFNREVRADGGRFAVVVVPSHETLTTATNRRSQLLENVARREAFPIVDLTPLYRSLVAAQGENRFFHSCDGHWTAAGHATAAEALQQFLTREGWLEQVRDVSTTQR